MATYLLDRNIQTETDSETEKTISRGFVTPVEPDSKYHFCYLVTILETLRRRCPTQDYLLCAQCSVVRDKFWDFFSREKVSGILFKASIMYKLFKSTGKEDAKLCKLFLMLKVLFFG